MRTRLFPVNRQSIPTSLGFSQGNEPLHSRQRVDWERWLEARRFFNRNSLKLCSENSVERVLQATLGSKTTLWPSRSKR
jgi:hypothetical protein